MEFNLLELVKTGRFGDLRIGLDEVQVIALLGEPEARSRKRKSLRILRYGIVQLHFESNQLAIMSVQFDAPRIWPPIRFVGWTPGVGTTRDEFIEALEAHGVAHRRLADVDPSMLITAGQAVVSFLNSELASISIESHTIRHGSG